MGLTRRAFLHVTGAAGLAAAVPACSGDTVPKPSPTPAPPTTTATTTVRPDLDGLRRALGGALVRPGDPDYDTARRSYNPLLDDRAPIAVATASTPDHVRACVDVARASGLPIAARSGGHSYAGYSVPDDGLVVDLGGMTRVDVRDDGTAVVGAGARLIDVYAALAEAGRSLPAGSCPTVGIAGLTLGGGLGVLARKYGLTCDKLIAAELVTADSRLLRADAETEPDLFWALRGGGGGNFGIVTDLTFATDPAPDLTVVRMDFAEGSMPDVVGAWQEWTAGLPPELWTNLIVEGGSPPRGRLNGCYVGPRHEAVALLADLDVRPVNRMVREMGYLEAMLHFAGCASVAACAPGRFPREAFAASSRILSEPLADPVALVDLLDGRDGLSLLLDALGGAVAEVAPDDTAFPHREALATVQIYQEANPAVGDNLSRPVAEVRNSLIGLGVRGGYVNYIEAAMPDWDVMYYGQNFNRLRDTARRYDPDGVFAFPQGVTPT
ncbi:FAD-binding dehydrogenase [Actinokineospora fastidiosa]|uniref:FAD-binding dehydrogenase n=1 Tax=Actinokineospora fastidiosa TaxID=1816 RepID=A0A918G8I8_9PSEU|nr:FAD-binding dehydrogenase [Actinokineospora fastidiosa]